MKIVVGNKLTEITKGEFEKIKDKFKNIEVDLGTGNGRYIYKQALENPKTLFIGIDPAEKQLRKYSKKAVRSNLKNTLFVLASAEMLPEDLEHTAQIINIILPWGSLLDYIANFDPAVIEGIKRMLLPKGILRIIFGYNKREEPTETERLGLEKLNETYLQNELIPQYERIGLKLLEYRKLKRENLKNFDTSWSKRLSYGKPRSLFLIKFQKID